MPRAQKQCRAKAGQNEALLAGLRARDESAFEQLVRRYSDKLLAVTRRYLRNEDDAQDALQDTFLSVFRVIDQFEGNAQLSTWLYRIASNAALMKLRTRRRRPEEPLDTHSSEAFTYGTHLEGQARWEEPVDVLTQRQETRSFVHDCITLLPELYRTALVLRDIHEFNTQEVADRLGVSPNAAKLRVHRARRALRGVVQTRLAECPL